MPGVNGDLRSFLNPASIAILGASADEHKLRGMITKFIVKNGYRGQLFFVNPSHKEINGRPCFPDVASLPVAVDLAVIVVPADDVISALEQCAAKGVKNALIMTSGFAEEGGRQSDAQDRIVEIARSTGIRVCGPNAEGFHNEVEGISATFSPAVDLDRNKLFTASRKRIGIIAQSGGIGFALYHRGLARGLQFSNVITSGNEADIAAADFLDHLVDDPDTDIVLLFLETVRKPQKFVAALDKAARARKPVIVVKVGRSTAGSRATASHTASMAGWDAAYDAVFAKYGAIVADDLDRALSIASAFSTCPLPRGRRAVVLTVSGGGGALAADALSAVGLELPELSADTQARIRALIPSYGATHNPVDVTGQATRTGAPMKVIKILDEGDEADIIVMVSTMANETRTPVAIDELKQVLARQNKPVFFFSYTVASEFGLRSMAEAGVITFSNLTEVANAARQMVRFAEFSLPIEQKRVTSNASKVLGSLTGVVPEYRAKEMLEGAGLAMPQRHLVTNGADINAAARSVGYPLVAKIQSADIPHKTEADGVRLNLRDAASVISAHKDIVASAARFKPDAKIDGVLIERMSEGGIELIVGVVRDDVFGPIVTVGAGGVTTELYQDVSRRAAPVSTDEALGMIRELKCFPLLDGFRGSANADLHALASVIAKISEFAVAHRQSVSEIECNPVIVHPLGKGCSIVDVMIVGAPESAQSS